MGIFTGLVIEVGILSRVERRTDGASLLIRARKVLDGTRIGDSISIDGADLTVIRISEDSFAAEASLETLARTTLGDLKSGSQVNLERALAVGERLGGHMVQGHIDGTGEVLSVVPEGNAHRVRIRHPKDLAKYIAMKGSIAVDGMSLTVAALDAEAFEIVVIPHTWENTTVKHYKPGRRLNLEVDVLAKYVERLIQNRNETAQPGTTLTLDYLIAQGY